MSIRNLLLHPLLPDCIELKGHSFTVANFPSSLKRTFVFLTQKADTVQRPGRCLSFRLRPRRRQSADISLRRWGLCFGSWTSNINPSSRLCALSTHHFSCMWSVMQVVEQFQGDPEKRNIFPCLFPPTQHGDLSHYHASQGVYSTLRDHLCFCSVFCSV